MLQHQVFILIISHIILSFNSCSSNTLPDLENKITTGAAQIDLYIENLKGKNVAIIANQTSVVHKTHLVDTLQSLGINIVKVFSPEHGFRGKAGAGEKVDDSRDEKTGIALISLYGSHRKPTKDDLQGVDIVVFDIQDVGTRFYTYISTMSYAMEACAENNVSFMVLDRPNPNGFYVDGPILEPDVKSFVGLHPIPIVHGMTVAEYALMVNSEKWLQGGVQCQLEVVKCKNYTHDSLYILPIKPSPNLPNSTAIYLYPSLCLFEGTIVSIGRGTDLPFQVFGHPNLPSNLSFEFTPESIEGAKMPKHWGAKCFGYDLSNLAPETFTSNRRINLQWLIDTYNSLKNDSTDFFTGYFDKLSGNHSLKQNIIDGWTEVQIRSEWINKLERFKKIREKYLLYPDFQE